MRRLSCRGQHQHDLFCRPTLHLQAQERRGARNYSNAARHYHTERGALESPLTLHGIPEYEYYNHFSMRRNPIECGTKVVLYLSWTHPRPAPERKYSFFGVADAARAAVPHRLAQERFLALSLDPPA